MKDIEKQIRDLVKAKIPNGNVKYIRNKGIWLNQIYEVTLDNGEVVILKTKANPEKVDYENLYRN